MKTRLEGNLAAIAFVLATSAVVPGTVHDGNAGLTQRFGDSAYGSHLQHLRRTSSALAERLQVYLPLSKRLKIGAAIDVARSTHHSGSHGDGPTDLRPVAVGGQHEVDRRWSVQWEIGSPRMGDLPLRDGLRLGARYRF